MSQLADARRDAGRMQRGMVVTEIATPTAELARASTASMLATPVARAMRVDLAPTWSARLGSPEARSHSAASPNRFRNLVTAVEDHDVVLIRIWVRWRRWPRWTRHTT